MILLAVEVDACVQLVARIRHRAVSRCTRARLHVYLARYGTKKHYAFGVTIPTGNTLLHKAGGVARVRYRCSG